jgi:hypothetical protein
MAAQDHIRQALPDEEVDDVVNVGLEVDLGRKQMAPVGQARQGRREDVMALRSKRSSNPIPAPTATPRAVHQHKCRHPTLTIGASSFARSLAAHAPSSAIFCPLLPPVFL